MTEKTKGAGLTRTDLEYMLDRMIASRFAKIDRRVAIFSMNDFAVASAKLENISSSLGYDLDFVKRSVETVGLAKSVKMLDANSQLTLKVVSSKVSKKSKKASKEEFEEEETDDWE